MALSQEVEERLKSALADRYTIESELGQGGMATVYLAQDLKHDRKVAVKVLKPEMAAVLGAERFLGEIKVTANLQHPHILPLHDSGETDGFLFYVMPFVEGETLRDKIDREKQLPVEEAVRIASDVGEALDHAHRNGVVHRDIKPANILLRDGRPLIADFGIALALSAAGGGRLTETGLSLGTPHYMSPEQATADRDPDSRSDVYSLGCMLFEMLTGEPPFTGATAQAVVSKILTEEAPHPSERRRSLPPNVEGAVLKATEKLPADRFGSMGEMKDALNDPGFRYGEPGLTSTGVPGWWKGLALGATVVAVISLGLVSVGPRLGGTSPEKVIRVRIALPDTARLSFAPGGLNVVRPALALSPKGDRLAYVGEGPGGPLLYLRDLDSDVPRPLPRTEGAAAPFFSPEGDWIAFFTETSLNRISLDGGEVVALSEVNLPHGGDWHGDRIIFSHGQSRELWEVSATSGEDPNPLGHVGFWPHFLPDGNALLISSRTDVGVLDLETGEVQTIGEGTVGRYIDGGQILVARSDGLWAQSFDTKKRTFTGSPRLVAPLVRRESADRAAQYTSSRNGVIAFVPGPDVALAILMWADRAGRMEALPLEPREFNNLSLSPDASRVLAGINDQLWVFDLERGSQSRLTREGISSDAIWHPDGRFIAFRYGGGGTPDGVYMHQVDGAGPAEMMLQEKGGEIFRPRSWTKDGRLLGLDVITEGEWGAGFLDTASDSDIQMITKAPGVGYWSCLSPDGRWIAYGSPDSGDDQMYVQPIPPTGERWQVSSDGGAEEPRWDSDSRELIYRSGNRWYSVSLREGASTPWTPPRLVLEGDFINVPGWSWDMTPDGSRFLVVQGPEVSSSASTINLILNWPPGG
ncbi:protein kinase [Gemmatimonadota bacterium]